MGPRGSPAGRSRLGRRSRRRRRAGRGAAHRGLGGLRRAAGAPGHVAGGRPRGLPLRRRTIRRRQDDAAAAAVRQPAADDRCRGRGRRGPGPAPAAPHVAVPAPAWLRVPELRAAAAPHRAGERAPAPAARADRDRRARRPGCRGPGDGGPRRQGREPPARAVWRTAAAGGDRQGHRPRARHPAGRRADRQPRPGRDGRGDARLRGVPRAGRHGDHGHARRVAARPLRPKGRADRPAGGLTPVWPIRYVATLWSYSWRWQRRRLSTWFVTAVVLGVVLSVAAAVQLVTWLGERSLAGQLQSASEMQVFLADGATADQQDTLRARLAGVPGVTGVAYRSKADAAARASRDPQLTALAG